MSINNPRLAEMLTIKHVADLDRVSPKSVQRWIASGELHAHRLGRSVRISIEDLAAFHAARRR